MTESGTQVPLLEARGITKEFPGVRALDQVTLSARAGEVHALVGENGAGKSTLIKILSGVYPSGSYGGDVLLDGIPVKFRTIRDAESAGIAVIHQELSLVRHMTVGENIFLGNEPHRLGVVDYDRLYHESEQLMRQMDVPVSVRSEVVNLGVGQQQLVEIARTVRKKSRILILDEPTAALSEHEVSVLMAIMKDLRARNVALIYISHRLDEVFNIADRITVLRDGRAIETRPTRQWSRPSVVRAMVGRELKEMFPEHRSQRGQVVMDVEHLSVSDPDVPGRRLLEDVSFNLRSGEILGIAGLMGAGRTELVSTLFGAAPGTWRGHVRIDGVEHRFNAPWQAIGEGVALVPEDRKRHGLALMFSVCENLSMVHLPDYCSAGIVDGQREFRACERKAAELGVRAVSLDSMTATLSGGNQQKVVLGKWLMKPPRILFLDEPTRGIDVGAKVEIYRLIRQLTTQGVAILMVSSELPEILGIADRILVLRRGRVGGEFSRDDASPEKIMEAAT
jgi:D-xylose transport system ATP-binding protein